MGHRIVSQLVQSLSHVRLFGTPRTAAHQAFLSITNSQSLLKLMFIELVMPFSHLILCLPLLLLPSIFPSNRVFSNELALHIRCTKYWSIDPSSEHLWLIFFRIEWFDLCSLRDFQESSPAPQFRKNQLFGAQSSLLSKSHLYMTRKILALTI